MNNDVTVEYDEFGILTIDVPQAPPSLSQITFELTAVAYDDQTDTLFEQPPEAEDVKRATGNRVIEWFTSLPTPVTSTLTILEAMRKPAWQQDAHEEDPAWTHVALVLTDRELFARLVHSLVSYAQVEFDGLHVHRKIVNIGHELFPEPKAPRDWTSMPDVARALAARGIDECIRISYDNERWYGCLDTGSWVSLSDVRLMAAFIVRWLQEKVIPSIDAEIALMPESVQAMLAKYVESTALAARARKARSSAMADMHADMAATLRLSPGVADAADLHDERMAYKELISIPKMVKFMDELTALTSLWIRMGDLDRHEHLIRTPNATVDLRSYSVYPIKPEQLMTRRTLALYQPHAQPPTRWLQFMEEVFPDPELRAYVRLALGYSITGSAAAKCIFVVLGPGDNGKSVLTSVIERLLGDYASTVPESAVTVPKSGGSSHPADVASLDGLRFGNVAEISSAVELSAARLKQLSSGSDNISARRMRENFYTFTPKAKLWLTGNDMPRIRDHGTAMRNRIVPIPMTAKIAKKDPGLAKYLIEQEGAAIFKWLIDAAREWYQKGGNRTALGEECAAQAEAKQVLLYQSDDYSDFHDTWVEPSDAESHTSSEFYKLFQLWCSEHGVRPVSHRAFSMDVTQRDIYRTKHTERGTEYNYVLKQNAQDAQLLAYEGKAMR